MMLRITISFVAQTAARTLLLLEFPSPEVARRAAATILPVAALQARARILKSSENGICAISGRPDCTLDISSTDYLQYFMFILYSQVYYNDLIPDERHN